MLSDGIISSKSVGRLGAGNVSHSSTIWGYR